MHTPPKVWDGVLERLRTSMPPLVLEAWILPLKARLEPSAPTSAKEAGEGEAPRAQQLTLEAPGAFHEARIRTRFLGQIRSAVANQDASVEVVLEAGPASPAIAPRGDETGAAEAGLVCQEQAAPAVGGSRRGRTCADQPSGHQTFDTFVVGPENALAREACLALAQQRQLGISPLFLAGGTGCGKTHLARATVAEARAAGHRVLQISSEQFTNAFTAGLRRKDMEAFKQRFRESCDLLVVEDVQFLEGKTATQLELFHTIEVLAASGRRVLLTGDRLPREMAGLRSRLVSQMTGALVAEIEPAGRELRRRILRSKASSGGVRLPDDCLDLITDRTPGNVRELEGVLIQLVATASLLGRRIDRELSEAALRKVTPSATPRLTVPVVLERVSSFFGLAEEELSARSRRRAVLVPRQIAIYLCHRYTGATLTDIGRALGRDLPAVKNAIRVVERAILERAPLRYQVECLVERLGIAQPVEPAAGAPVEPVDTRAPGPAVKGPRKVLRPVAAAPRKRA